MALCPLQKAKLKWVEGNAHLLLHARKKKVNKKKVLFIEISPRCVVFDCGEKYMSKFIPTHQNRFTLKHHRFTRLILIFLKVLLNFFTPMGSPDFIFLLTFVLCSETLHGIESHKMLPPFTQSLSFSHNPFKCITFQKMVYVQNCVWTSSLEKGVRSFCCLYGENDLQKYFQRYPPKKNCL